MDMRRSLLAVGLIASLLVLAGCGGGATTATTGTQAETPPAAGSQTPAEPSPAAMGKPATAGDWTITVKNVARAETAGGGSPSAGNELLVITYELTNGGAAGKGNGPTDFTLADAGGATFQAAPTGDPKFIFNTQQPIKAGETREILIAYDVTKGAGPFVWTFSPFGAPKPAVLEVE